MIAALDDGNVAGFLSYISDRPMDIKGFPCVEYLSTILVEKNCRGRGISKKLYEKFIELSAGKSIVTRTWSTNESHLGLLSKLGFVEIKRIKDDRGDGIDTVYFGKCFSEKE